MTISYWHVFFLSAFPITELRATIPLALAMGMTPIRAYIIAVIGNILPILPILLLLQPVSEILRKFPVLDSMFQKILVRSRRKSGQIHRYGYIGLMLFVAIPLPGTGAWTGAVLSWLLGLDIILSALAISAGVIIAGIIVLMASLGVIKTALIFDLEVFAVLAAAAFVAFIWFKRKKKS